MSSAQTRPTGPSTRRTSKFYSGHFQRSTSPSKATVRTEGVNLGESGMPTTIDAHGTTSSSGLLNTTAVAGASPESNGGYGTLLGAPSRNGSGVNHRKRGNSVSSNATAETPLTGAHPSAWMQRNMRGPTQPWDLDSKKLKIIEKIAAGSGGMCACACALL